MEDEKLEDYSITHIGFKNMYSGRLQHGNINKSNPMQFETKGYSVLIKLPDQVSWLSQATFRTGNQKKLSASDMKGSSAKVEIGG